MSRSMDFVRKRLAAGLCRDCGKPRDGRYVTRCVACTELRRRKRSGEVVLCGECGRRR